MKWAIFFAVLFILSAVLNVFFLTKGKDIKTTLPTYKVLEVFDGDSFLIEGKHEIRLRQAQAPEKGLCGHIEAKNALTKLIKDKYVKLDYQIPDIYGRQMAMVFVDDLNVNKEMVISGLARYHHDTTPFEKEMKLAGIKAKENGIEYGMMEAIAEGATVLKESDFNINLPEVFRIYNNRSVIESRLVGWTQEALSEDPNLNDVSSKIAHTGEGEWTIKTAEKLNVPVPVIKKSFEVRVESEKDNPNSPSGFRNKVVSALRGKFGGHKVKE